MRGIRSRCACADIPVIGAWKQTRCAETLTRCSQRVVREPSCEALRTEAGSDEGARIAAVRAKERVVVVDL